MSDGRTAAAPGTGAFGLAELGLYALTVCSWSSSWIGMKLQVETVPVWQSALYRFLIAAVVMFAWVALSRRRMLFPARLHLRFALVGALMFSTNFILFYAAAQWITSGLLAVMFSLVTVMNPINAAIFLRERISPRVVVGAAIGISGIALIFWPEMARPESAGHVAAGLACCVFGTLSFSLGNIVASTIYRDGYPVISSNAWAMLYGVVVLSATVAVAGDPLTFDSGTTYVTSLIALATLATVVPMASYLTLMRRIGPGRAGYATVMFPIGALVISWLFEGYQWHWPAVAGLVLALAGNIFVLRAPRVAVPTGG